MKAFKDAIKQYLDNRAMKDALFAEAYKQKGKTIDECVNYILCEVQKIAKMTDDEVFGMAVHYYDEADVKADKKVHANVVITGEYAPQKATVLPSEEKTKKTAKPKITKKNVLDDRQLSLFGF